jgi:hypothetical protein
MPVFISGIGAMTDDEYFAICPKNDYDLIHTLPNGARLYMGGTPDSEDLLLGDVHRLVMTADHPASRLVTKELFDVRVDLYGYNHRAAKGVEEHTIRLGDSEIERWDGDRLVDLEDAVYFTLCALKRGDRVLVNCQAGLNRSGLVTGLALIAYGVTPDSVVELIRAKRAPLCLANATFAHFLETKGAAFVAPIAESVGLS